MKNILLLLFTICFFKSYSQKEKGINLIIEIDEKIIARSLTNLKIILTDSNNIVSQIDADYYVGNLNLKDTDYQNLLLSKSICLKFDYTEYNKGKQETHNYELNLKNSGLKSLYNIIKIYNLNKRKYRKHNVPFDKDKDYVFLLETPNFIYMPFKVK